MFSAVPEGLARALTAACGTRPITWRYAETIGSTNDAAAALAASGAPAGTIVVADQQTAGRGRRGRTFLTGLSGALTFSVLWRTPRPLPEAPP